MRPAAQLALLTAMASGAACTEPAPPASIQPAVVATSSLTLDLDAARRVTAVRHLAQIRDRRSGALLHTHTTGGPIIEHLAASPDGARLLAKVKGNGFVVWDTVKAIRLRGVPARHVVDFVVPDAKHVIYLTAAGDLRKVALTSPPRVTARARARATVRRLVLDTEAGVVVAEDPGHREVFRTHDLEPRP